MQTTTKEKGRPASDKAAPMQTGEEHTADTPRRVALTPRHRRILVALLSSKRCREDIDRIAGVSNGPDEVMRLRRRFSLSIPCPRKREYDMDGRPVEVGVYHLTDADRDAVREILAREVSA